MTLEEAIKLEEHNSENYYSLANTYHTDEGVYLTMETKARNQAEYHEQLADWLKDYKRLLEQQFCDDCISRDMALEKMADYVASGYADSAEDFEEYSRIICQLPPVTPQTMWIPVSERLPEEDGCYLVTTTGTNNDIIDIAYYTDGIWHKASRIKAWQPLPKPYKAESEE